METAAEVGTRNPGGPAESPQNDEQFGWLLEKVQPDIQKKDTRFRKALDARTELAVTLRYLATGDSWATLGTLYKVPTSTLSRCLPEVYNAIFKALQSYIEARKNRTSGNLKAWARGISLEFISCTRWGAREPRR